MNNVAYWKKKRLVPDCNSLAYGKGNYSKNGFNNKKNPCCGMQAEKKVKTAGSRCDRIPEFCRSRHEHFLCTKDVI